MLYIRHGEKTHRNGKATNYSLDPGLTERGKELAKERFSSLLDKYGVPNRIVSSPLLRARETAKIAQDVILRERSVLVDISYQPLIGEYFGNMKGEHQLSDLTPETVSYGPLFETNISEYGRRIGKYLQLPHQDGWYITHGIVIQTICKFLGKKISYPKELTGALITPTIDHRVYNVEEVV